ncbi:hypothetical protein CY34DRAFT_811650 [Suillus luteus UH-Slu-Lm8-n1]|uniref:Uncharacterized protein n=1 Tax=Suillus luteus UH-Slu-Lm8-n1 TaxID=930992 RepID=A0A0D0AW11_9AGAM|nr:hypothetical protein CY34DRAFT_811650 [Suillus luteus UH-Slu-Lm8-n1]
MHRVSVDNSLVNEHFCPMIFTHTSTTGQWMDGMHTWPRYKYNDHNAIISIT